MEAAGGRGANIIKALCSLVLTLLLTIQFAAGKAGAEEKRLTVAAAADLTFALKEIAAGFEKETGVKVILSFGSTGMLTKQIEEGAPFDVFFAADSGYIERLKKEGHVIADTVFPYARGRLVLAVNKASGVKARELKDLLSPGIKRVVIANPEHAPYGRAAMEAMKKAGVWEEIKPRLVYGENIRQTLQYIQTGDAQAGIVARSLTQVPEASYSDIDPKLHSPIEQAAGVIKGSRDEADARAFLKYVNSAGRPVLKRYGFITPDGF